jgi:putative sugar O-methyltransferase
MNNSWDVNLSMIENYLQACKEFVDNQELFNNFKRDSRYTPVLEHLTEADGNLYYDEMKHKELLSEELLKSVKENDSCGNPVIFKHSVLGTISPTTTRYLKNSLDIFSHFKQNKKVLEIGGGYGGLCKVFSVVNKFSYYYLVDFPEVLDLSKKYLSQFSTIKNKIYYIPTDSLRDVSNLDLVISNYAFSECSKETQLEYYERFIKKSKNFYLVYNNFTENNMNSQEFIELATKDFHIEIETEIRPPHTVHILYGRRCS